MKTKKLNKNKSHKRPPRMFVDEKKTVKSLIEFLKMFHIFFCE